VKNTKIDKLAQNLTNAFIHNRTIAPIPINFTKNILEAEKLRKLCESKVKQPIIGFKAGGTGIKMLKKWGIKKPFYAAVYKKNLLKTKQNVKINPYILGAELEVGYYIKKNFFESKGKITRSNIHKYISHRLPAIEIVGYRQRKRGLKYLGDLSSDFGGNIKFLIGKKTKHKKNNSANLKATLSNKKINQTINGNTSTVYINPLNSLKLVLNFIKKDKIKLNKDFYVFTGSAVGVVPILSKGLYEGRIETIGTVKVKII
jgi:2-keto-4-pentenoate hydratase|tara:strand:- start:262 stop:1038 length:777 start_codon:yes stop_codon:yes gene_type:complete